MNFTATRLFEDETNKTAPLRTAFFPFNSFVDCLAEGMPVRINSRLLRDLPTNGNHRAVQLRSAKNSGKSRTSMRENLSEKIWRPANAKIVHLLAKRDRVLQDEGSGKSTSRKSLKNGAASCRKICPCIPPTFRLRVAFPLPTVLFPPAASSPHCRCCPHHHQTTLTISRKTSACPPSSSSSSRSVPTVSTAPAPLSCFQEHREDQPALPIHFDLHFFVRVKTAGPEVGQVFCLLVTVPWRPLRFHLEASRLSLRYQLHDEGTPKTSWSSAY